MLWMWFILGCMVYGAVVLFVAALCAMNGLSDEDEFDLELYEWLNR